MEKQTAGTRECRLEAEEQEVTGSDSGIGIWGWQSSGQLRHSVSAQSGSTTQPAALILHGLNCIFLVTEVEIAELLGVG